MRLPLATYPTEPMGHKNYILEDLVECKAGSCGNQGVCRLRPSLSNICNCDLTSFTGPTCLDGKLVDLVVPSETQVSANFYNCISLEKIVLTPD